MTSECLDRLRMYINGTRKQDVLAARNSRLNGYNSIACDHENRVIIADLILQDLASERDTGRIVQIMDVNDF